MSRIPGREVDSLDDRALSLYERRPMNFTLMLLGASPDVAQGFSDFTGSLYSGSSVPPRLREIAALRVGYLSDAAYELFQHVSLARMAGITDEEMEAIREGGAGAAVLGPDGSAVLAFTDDIVQNVRAGDETLAAVRAHLDDQQVLDLTLGIGCFMMVSRFLETAGVEIDEAPLDRRFVSHPGPSPA